MIERTLGDLDVAARPLSAKSSYDARESEIKQLTAYVILLDTLLAQYGEEAQPARASLRQAVPAVADRIWREGQSVPLQGNLLRPRLRVNPSTAKFRRFNPPTTIKRTCEGGFFRSPRIRPRRGSFCFRILVVRSRFLF